MKKEVFLNDYVTPKRKANQTCVSILEIKKGHEPQASYLLEKYQTIKGLFMNIDFECNIKPNGSCKNHSTNKCCCYDCKNNIGYIHIMLKNQIPLYAKHFNGRTGFWRKNKGCILPHHMRSTTCLTHHCNHYYDDNSSKNQHFSKGVMFIRQLLNDTRKELRECCDRVKGYWE
jgi:hypothetical protein